MLKSYTLMTIKLKLSCF